MRSLKRLMAVFMVIMMCFGMVPTQLVVNAYEGGSLDAVAEEKSMQASGLEENGVRVIVENTTYAVSEGAAWDGVLVDTWVTLKDTSTMMSVVAEALDAKGYSHTGTDTNYITMIKGIKEMDAGQQSGWMGTLNDWFTNEGFAAFTAASGKLQAGDEIRMLYTKDYGHDIGGLYDSQDKNLSKIEPNVGELEPAFSGAVKSYSLTVPVGTQGVMITPTAINKNFQVRTSVGTTEYKRTAKIPIVNGTAITVKCGDPAWPSANNGTYGNGSENVPAEVYTINIKMEETANQTPNRKAGVSESVDQTIALGGTYSQDLSMIFEDADNNALTYKVSVNGAEAVEANSAYTITPADAGIKTLVFTANDGKANSTDTYKVNLSVVEKPTSLSISGSDILKKRPNYDWYHYITGSAENNQFTLTATALPAGTDNAVKWSSNGVSDGIIIDENTGMVTVNYQTTDNACYTTFTATSTADSQIKASFDVYIVPPMYEYNGRSGLTVTLPEKGGTATSSEYLFVFPSIYNDYDNGFLKWEIADETVAKLVTNGSTRIIEGLKPGTTTITATNTLLPSKTMSFTAEVKGVKVLPQDPAKSSYVKQGDSLQLVAVGSSADEKFTWTSAQESVATVDSTGKVTAIKEGSAYIYAASSALNGETPYKGGILINVIRDERAPYLTGLDVTNYSTYQEWTGSSSGFGATTLNYEFNAKAPSATTMTFNLKPAFNNELYKATVSYGGETLEYKASAETKNLPVNVGENTFVLRLASRTDENQYTDYTFKVTRPRNTVATLKSMSIVPENRTLYTASDFKYRNQAEGAFFRLDTNGQLTAVTGVTATVKGYRAYLFDDINRIALSAAATDIGAHLKISIDGGAFIPFENNGKTNYFNLNGNSKETTVVIQSCSDQTYYKNQLEGKEDPFVVEDTDTLTVEKVTGTTALLSDVKIANATLSAGDFCSPTFSSDLAAFYAITPSDKTAIDLTLEVPKGIKLYKGTTVSDANLLTPAENGQYVVSLPIPSATANQSFLVVGEIDGQTVSKTYAFNLIKEKDIAGTPDRVVDYLALGSQYTNSSNYGMFPEVTLSGTLKSLGNFGGYIVYQYNNPIKNDPASKFGVDFVVYGNSFGGSGASEPGNVLVSQDGKTWYTLAGSEHFDDTAIWDYELSYTKGSAGESIWNNQYGNKGTNYTYPLAKNYPLFAWNEANAQSMTAKGVLLTSSATDPYGSMAAAYPAFGYADVNSNGTIGAGQGNPYIGTHESKGDGFDISWAVDEHGNPVKLDNISYVKVATASSIYAGAIGEKSTEVTALVRTEPEASAVGKSSISAITVDNQAIALKEGTDVYAASYQGAFDVKVEASEGSNVYINNQKGTSRSFETAPREGIVRVIVQQDQKEASIYYLHLNETPPNQMPSRKAGVAETVNQTITLGEAYSLDLSTIFEDADNNALTYKVSVNGAEAVAASNSYTITPTEVGTKTLLFTANDGQVDSTDVYRVNLVVNKPVVQPVEMFVPTGTYLNNTVTNPKIGSISGDWVIIGLARSGFKVPQGYYEKYLANVLDMVKTSGGVLDTVKYTEYSRVVLALTAIGYDVTDVAGYNLLKPLADYQKVSNQGINGQIYALIALDSHNYNIPAATAGVTQTTREGLVEAILKLELANGGWSFMGSKADIDITAMTIQALAPYYNSNSNVKAAVDRGLGKLSESQNSTGIFGSSSESCSQVIIALTSLGINPANDERFIKNGNTALSALADFYVEGGGFKHTLTGARNQMATEQGYLALAAYNALISGKNRLYDMSDISIQNEQATKDKKAATAVIDQIAALGTITNWEQKAGIEAARSAYDQLTVAQKALVTMNTLNILKAAETAVEKLKPGNSTNPTNPGDDTKIAKAVTDQIGALPAVAKLALTDKAAVAAARTAFEALSDAQKALVTNQSTLTAAEAQMAKLIAGEATAVDKAAAKAVSDQIASLSTGDKLTLGSKADVAAARVAYNSLTDIQKTLITNLDALAAAETRIAELEKATPSVKDEATGIEMVGLPEGVGLKVEPESGDAGKTDEAEKAATEAGIKDAKVVSLYSIKPDMSADDLAKFNSDPNSFVTLTMPLGDDQQGYDNYKIYHKKTDGTVEWITPTLTADKKSLIFKVNAFSEFGVVATKASTEIPAVDFSYRTHVQNVGWQDWKNNGAMSGTQGQSLRLEGIEIKRTDKADVDLGIRYETHIENIGWEDSWKADGKMSGTEGRSLRLEAIRIELTGADAANYDVYYQVHAQNTGWMAFAKNGADAGTAGFGYRLEGIHVVVVPKGQAAPTLETGSIDTAFLVKN